jgi:hypothetical protein
MPEPWWFIPIGLAVLALVAVLCWRPVKRAAHEARFTQARKGFHQQREWLEVQFLQLVETQAKPESPKWASCEFDDPVSYVRHRSTGELSAFVAVTLALESVSKPSASATDLIGNLRVGTAVFRFDKDHWSTDGRVILNLSPSEAIRFYQNDFEMVGQEK